jgi:hypothetical protein
MIRIGFFLITVLLLPLVAVGGELSLKNDREGKSFYHSWSFRRQERQALKQIDSQVILSEFTKILSKTPEDKLCSLNLVNQWQKNLKGINPEFNQTQGALNVLRSNNEIDDVVLKILTRANKLLSGPITILLDEDQVLLPIASRYLPQLLNLVADAEKKLADGCLDEVYRNLIQEITKLKLDLADIYLQALFIEAYETQKISYRTYYFFEQSRINQLEKINFDLKSYYKKIKSLRANSPLPNSLELSGFATGKFDKKSSRRQHLLENYSDIQILLMANVIKKLRSRLDSNKVEIHVYAHDQVDEVIPLEPMERFRFAIKILRKEMALLSLNTYFKGHSPSYVDLMSAAFEAGIIPAEEMTEIAGLELIWNPKEGFWKKASFWIKTFGTATAVVMPAPFGFLPVLAVLVIEATTSDKNNNNDDSSLF